MLSHRQRNLVGPRRGLGMCLPQRAPPTFRQFQGLERCRNQFVSFLEEYIRAARVDLTNNTEVAVDSYPLPDCKHLSHGPSVTGLYSLKRWL